MESPHFLACTTHRHAFVVHPLGSFCRGALPRTGLFTRATRSIDRYNWDAGTRSGMRAAADYPSEYRQWTNCMRRGDFEAAWKISDRLLCEGPPESTWHLP